MRSEAACGITVVLVITGGLVTVTQAILLDGYSAPLSSVGAVRLVFLALIYAEAAVAVGCLVGLMWGDPGVVKRSQANCFPLPPEVARRIALGEPLAMSSAPARCHPHEPFAPALEDGSVTARRRRRCDCRWPGILRAMLRVATRWWQWARYPLLRRERYAPLSNLSAMREPIRPPLRRFWPVHRGREHEIFQDHPRLLCGRCAHGLRLPRRHGGNQLRLGVCVPCELDSGFRETLRRPSAIRVFSVLVHLLTSKMELGGRSSASSLAGGALLDLLLPLFRHHPVFPRSNGPVRGCPCSELSAHVGRSVSVPERASRARFTVRVFGRYSTYSCGAVRRFSCTAIQLYGVPSALKSEVF